MNEGNQVNADSTKQITHTPGPWIVSPHAKNLVATADDKLGIADVAMCAPWITKPPQEQQDANAMLMADAPKMLELIREFHDFAEPMRHWQYAERGRQAFRDAAILLGKHGG